MAQYARRRSGRLARRFGLRQGGRVMATLAVAVTILAGAGIARLATTTNGFVVEHLDAVDADAAKRSAPVGTEPSTDEPEEPPIVVVHVDGAVVSPGVFELEGEKPRVADAVKAAGGLTEDADTSVINLAATLSDGQKVYIPKVGERLDEAIGTAATQPSDSSTSVVNINSATAEELMTLPGVGDATARAIIEERERGGPYSSVEDLMRVSGIGEKKLARLQGLICV